MTRYNPYKQRGVSGFIDEQNNRQIACRFKDGQFKEIDKFARRNDCSFTEAIRRLCAEGIKTCLK